MPVDFIHIVLAFFEGFALIISPCILPILPIILAGAFTGNRARPIGIICGFILIFTLFTLFSRLIFQVIPIDPNTLRYLSFAILILFGIILTSEFLSEKFSVLTGRLLKVNKLSQSTDNTQGGFLSGLLFGGVVAIIWTPCAGPILAAVIVQVIIQKSTLGSVLTIFAFAVGVGIPMLLIALVGRKITHQLNFFRKHALMVRRILGVIIILSVLAMLFVPVSYTTSNETKVINKNGLVNALAFPYNAPDFKNLTAWINSKPLTINDLKGKVVLIDFWTYSCINCLRTLPYLKKWYTKYHDNGFEIIGVHSPEFIFEQDINNVKNAVIEHDIKYPVALDNQFATWQNYKNHYWPAHYLINKEGQVVYEHFGEGEYDVTENNIRYLLNMKPISTTAAENAYSARTPETYLGFARAANFASSETVQDDEQAIYTYPKELALNQWALQGKWVINSDKIVGASKNASLKLHFSAMHVYCVMGSKTPVTITLKLNGRKISNHSGKDVKDSSVLVSSSKLYSLLIFDKETEANLELIVSDPGLEIYTFTFG